MRRKGVDGASVARRGIESTIIPHLEKLEEALSCKVSDRDDGVQDGGGGGCPSTHQRIVDWGLVGKGRVWFHLIN